MSLPEFEDVRNMRGHATRVAARLSMIGKHNIAQVEKVSWRALSTAPSWCLADSDTLCDVQRTCGVFYLAPLIRNSIDGGVLRQLSSFIGEKHFHFVRKELQLNHTVDLSEFEQHIDLQIMAAGSSVLVQTLQDSTLKDLFSEIIGPPGSDIEVAVAQSIYMTACSYLGFGAGLQSSVNVA